VSSCAAASEIYGEQTLDQQGYEVFVEIGQPALLGMGRQCLSEGVGGSPVCIKAARIGNSSFRVWGIVRAWSASGLAGFDRLPHRRLQLPTYPCDNAIGRTLKMGTQSSGLISTKGSNRDH